CYIREGNRPGSTVEGVAWDVHFTDLRIAVTNPTDDDYSGLDIALIPDPWVNTAKIYDDKLLCTLSAIEGGRSVSAAMRLPKPNSDMKITFAPLGQEFETSDTEGNLHIVVARDTGYRLRCNVLPHGETIKMLFAAVVPLPGVSTVESSRR